MKKHLRISSKILGLALVLLLQHTIQAQLVSTFAGSGAAGSLDGSGTNASFNSPNGIAMDGTGNFYVTDMSTNLIRKISSSGVVSTFAGSGAYGNANGVGTAASFRSPAGVAVDASGNVFVADWENHTIRKITSAGVVSTFAGSGSVGSADGTGTAASFNYPFDIAIDASGTLYVSDQGNHAIRKITTSGEVTTLAGSGSPGYLDANGTAAQFNNPSGLTVDLFGDLLVADLSNNRIRKVSTSSGILVTTYSTNTFNQPSGVAFDGYGNLYITEQGGNRIKKLTSVGVATTLAGSGSSGSADGLGILSSFNTPSRIVSDGTSGLYVTDRINNKIRKITLIPEIKITQGTTELVSGVGSYNFGNVNELSSSADITFTIENVAPTGYLLFLSGTPKVTLSGSDASEFVLNQSSTSSFLLEGETTTFTIKFSPVSSGPKTAIVTIESNDVDEASYVFTITGTGLALTSLSDSGKKPLFRLYPNPTESNLQISTESNHVHLEWFDAKGNLVLEKMVNEGINEIPMEEFKSGIYLLRAMDSQGNVQEEKLIKR
jgi:sugar lactone lactonase YvrE